MPGGTKSSHRERLIEAMTVTAARYGYREASVARVIKQAGVSRATFYAHFADRDECFLATYRELARPVWHAIEDAAGSSWAEGGTRRLIDRLLAGVERDPARARILLIESLAAGPVVRSEHERLLAAIEAAIDRYFERAGGTGERIEVPARVALGGIGGAIGIRVFHGEAGELAGLADDLLVWLESYAVPGGRDHRSQVRWDELGRELAASLREEMSWQNLPRGRSALPAAVVASEHRERILDAVGLMAKEKGFMATTVADLVAVAGVTREAFYEQFRSKLDAFLAAQGKGLEESVALVSAEYFSEAPWPERVWNAGQAILVYTARNADNAYVDLVESYTTGSEGIQRSFDNRLAYTVFLEDGYRQRPEADRLPRLCSEAISGGLTELLRRQVVLGRIDRCLELAPQGAYVTLAPFIGAAEAIEFVEERVAAVARG